MTIAGITTRLPELRADTDQPKQITGYGAVYYRAGEPGTEYWLWNDTVERIMPGAFDEAVRTAADVRSAFNHDFNFLLGRTTAGTLLLSLDATGLKYEVTPPATRADVLELVQRRDVSGSSFMFVPVSTTWKEERIDGNTIYIREITNVELFEVGPVGWPAYEATTAEARGNTPAAVTSRFAAWLTEHRTNATKDRDRWLLSRGAVSRRNRERFLKCVEIELAQRS